MQSHIEFAVEAIQNEQAAPAQVKKSEALNLVYLEVNMLDHIGGGEIVVNY